MANIKPPVKKWTHTLYYGTGKLIKAPERIKDAKKGQIRVRFPSVKDAWAIIDDLNEKDTKNKLYIPVRKDGVSTFKPDHKEADISAWPIKFKDIPDFGFNDEDWCLIIVMFDTVQNEEEFWTHIKNNPNSGINYIPNEITKSFWLPEKAPKPTTHHRWVSDLPLEQQLPQYPIYVLSKGRYEKRLTADALNEMGCPFYLLIEDCEKELYKSSEKYPTNYLIMPPELDNKGCGSITARNFAWAHSEGDGDHPQFDKHWVMDDNMNGFFRFHKNQRIKCVSPIAIKQCEIITSQYDNVYLSGLQYKSFCPEICKNKANVIKNTRIYSCILIRNDLDVKLNTEKWRGKYNEDTDLSLRVLKSGGCNLLLQNFLCDKQTTMSCKGGNTDGIYAKNIDGLKLKYDSLYAQHPDVVKPSKKFSKTLHHQVDYSKWANNPLKLNGVEVSSGSQTLADINEYGLKIIELVGKPTKMKKPRVKEQLMAEDIPEIIPEVIKDEIIDEIVKEVKMTNEIQTQTDPIIEEAVPDMKHIIALKDRHILNQANKIKKLEALLELYMNQ
jgi:hypothetical protein